MTREGDRGETGDARAARADVQIRHLAMMNILLRLELRPEGLMERLRMNFLRELIGGS